MPPPFCQSYGHKENTNETIVINIIIVVVIGFTFSKRNTGILLDKRGTVTTATCVVVNWAIFEYYGWE